MVARYSGGHSIGGLVLGVLQYTDKTGGRMVARYSGGHSIGGLVLGVLM